MKAVFSLVCLDLILFTESFHFSKQTNFHLKHTLKLSSISDSTIGDWKIGNVSLPSKKDVDTLIQRLTLWTPDSTPERDTSSTSIESLKSILDDISSIPTNGIIDYIGNTKYDNNGNRWTKDDETSMLLYKPLTSNQLLQTKFNLWKQLPWKKINRKVVLKAKIGGELPLVSTPTGFSLGPPPDLNVVTSLSDVSNMFIFAANDPRILSIFIEITPMACGYAKLIELKRSMEYFKKSGKRIYGYSETASEKELFVSLSCDEFYIPPDGSLDLRGFSGGATFLRGVFDKLGIEPQVQRIGKYKSFGDTFNRTEISEAQREVTSSLLMEASEYWLDAVASSVNQQSSSNKSTTQDIQQIREELSTIWSDYGVKTPYDYAKLGFISGVRYYDQVEEMIQLTYRDRRTSLIQNIASWWRNITDTGGGDASEADITSSTVNITSSSSEDKTAVNVSAAAVAVRPPVLSFQTMMDMELKNRNIDFNLSEVTLIRRVYTPQAVKTLISAQRTESESAADVNLSNKVDEDPSSIAKAQEKANKAQAQAARLYETYKLKKERSMAKLYPSGLYLRKMRKGYRILAGLPIREVFSGKRVAVINAVGGIASGQSGRGAQGASLGSETFVEDIRRARNDPSITAVVIRIDSPGGSALASDIMWREVRMCALRKPVVASQVDVAASGGYYISMACDQIVAEDLTITGSIGVVTAKFNLQALNKRIGFNTETISRGRYAEVLSTSRGFTPIEAKYFEDGAHKAYLSFITKAALSRNMTVEAMNEVAQGRVWTGKQALTRGLVDHIGGLWKAIEIASVLAESSPSITMSTTSANQNRGKLLGLGITRKSKNENNATITSMSSSNKVYNIEVFRPKSSGLPFPFGGNSGRSAISRVSADVTDPLYLCDDIVSSTGMASADTLGTGGILQSFGGAGGPLLGYFLNHDPNLKLIVNNLFSKSNSGVGATIGAQQWLNGVLNEYF